MVNGAGGRRTGFLSDMLAAYDTFGRAAETKALKVIIDR